MNISIILILSESKKANSKTLKCLSEELAKAAGRHEVLAAAAAGCSVPEGMSSLRASVKTIDASGMDTVGIYRACADIVTGDYVTMLYGGDTWSKGYLRRVEKCGGKTPVMMTRKSDPYGKGLAFAHEKSGYFNIFTELKNRAVSEKNAIINLNEKLDYQPMYLGGTFVRSDLFTPDAFSEDFGLETERRFFMSIMAAHPEFCLVGGAVYVSPVGREGNVSIFPDVYEKEWYFDSLSKFWIPYLKGFGPSGSAPLFIQANCMFSLKARLMANKDNQNKHILSADETAVFYSLLSDVLKLLSDRIVFNEDFILSLTSKISWVLFGILKYGPDFRFCVREVGGRAYLAAGKGSDGLPVTVNNTLISELAIDTAFMEYRNGSLHFDGVAVTELHYVADDIYMYYNGKKYPLEYNGSYALTKFFGESAYKEYPFSVELPYDSGTGRAKLEMRALINGKEYPVQFSYRYHYSRMSDACRSSHWCFGDKKQYMMTRNSGSSVMRIHKTSAAGRFGWEALLILEMFLHFDMKYWQFIIVRLAFHISKPFLKRKQVWLYFDKIYKGGDSAEYLYRYAVKQNDPGISHYYLVDKNAPDCKRLVNDGYKPLIRKSLLHRLVFLHADMMVISNSTAFTFNNYGRINSSFVRDLIDSHCVCVQHGMSVQKIAKAQRRLMDNTRLYFCASKYEIENLSKPIYGYTGRYHDALKLTGVPRHDGLRDRHIKQIMISPTWRMQASMKIRTSEGEARDYNPLFKETSYYKVYNSLINDHRLLEAARKHGYSIKYVLHPIVSVQAKDFTANDVVEIVPSIGDMSYEKMFCESALMITDFSGVQFDFAYMRKPVLYLHSDEIPAHYDEGTFFYDTMGFGEIARTNDELISLIIEYMENGCVMKDEYRRRADDFFAFHDHDNCRRVYDEMIKYAGENLR